MKRITKKFSNVLTARSGYLHAVKKTVSAKGSRVIKNIETYCGRDRVANGPDGSVVSAGVVTCQSCIKAIQARHADRVPA